MYTSVTVSHCDLFTAAPWATLPVSVTMWSYCFGALSMGLASVYYCTQPEVFVLPVEVSSPSQYCRVYKYVIT